MKPGPSLLGLAAAHAVLAYCAGSATAAPTPRANRAAVRVEAQANAELFAVWRRAVVRNGLDRRVIDSLGTPALVAAMPARRARPATPAYVVVGTAEGDVLALDGESGRLRWRYSHGTAIDGVVTVLSRREVGLGQDDAPYMALVGARDQMLVALEVHSGRKLWVAALDAPSRAPVTAQDGRLYVTTEANQVVALEARSGRVLWSQGRNASPGLALLGHGRAAVAEGRVVAAFSDGFVMAIDAHDGHVLWERPLSLQGGRFVDADADPVLRAGKVYVASMTDGIYALSLTTGQPLWTQPGAEVLSLCWLPADAALQRPYDLLIAGDVFGQVRALAPEDGATRWRLDAGEGPITGLVPFLHGVAFLAGGRGLIWAEGRHGRPISVQALGGMPGGSLATLHGQLSHLSRSGALSLWQGPS